MLKKNSLWLLLFYVVVATYFYYEKVPRKVRTAIASNILKTKLDFYLYHRELWCLEDLLRSVVSSSCIVWKWRDFHSVSESVVYILMFRRKNTRQSHKMIQKLKLSCSYLKFCCDFLNFLFIYFFYCAFFVNKLFNNFPPDSDSLVKAYSGIWEACLMRHVIQSIELEGMEWTFVVHLLPGKM